MTGPTPRKTNRVESVVGSCDGIRSGALWVDGLKRGYFHDRLNGVVRIFKLDPINGRIEDVDESRVSAARLMLEIAWDLELVGSPQDQRKPGGNRAPVCGSHVEQARGAVL